MTQSFGTDLNRRRLFQLTGGAAALAAVAGEADALPAAPSRSEQITVSEGTNIAVRAAPDGKRIAFDTFGVLWLAPIEGGAAQRLTDDLFEVAQPDWSPDGGQIVFQSYRDGNFHIWRINADGSGLAQLTFGPFDHREPRYSPDGKRIALSSDRGGGRYGLFILDIATAQLSPVATPAGDAFEPSWSADGARLAFTLDKVRILTVELASGQVREVAKVAANADRFTAGALSSPAFTPDGSDIVFSQIEPGRAELRLGSGAVVVAGEDAFPFRVSWLSPDEFLYTADGLIKRRRLADDRVQTVPVSVSVPVQTPRYVKKKRDFDSPARRPVVGIGAPALSPDGKRIVFRALNDLYLLEGSGPARPLFRDGAYKVDPAWSPDGKTLAYASDKGGKLDLWLYDLASRQARQLTHQADAAVSPAWSHDGRRIAFLNQNGGLHGVEVATGEVRRLYSDLWEPGKPSWGPGDRTILYSAFKPYSPRVREGLSEILTVDLARGNGSYQPIAPHKSLGTRGDDGPVVSPDGRSIAYVFASRLWVAPIDASGKLAGAGRVLNDEVTDAPSWRGDGQELLYISAGKLRRIPVKGGPAQTVPHGLTWAAARPQDKLVISAARLWDGRGHSLRRDVEVVLEGNRISAIVPKGRGPTDARRIDAGDRTILPGLIDIHTHRQMQGYGYGDREGRLWLSLGVTATRSPGGPAYHTVEDQEAIESGARLGPRYFATGEAIDGGRIYYNFMRPVTEPGQLALELQRVEALNYDLIKTYVRLPPDQQQKVIAWAHDHGLHVTSHYHYPALGFGIDGMEHLGATSRTGYSRTLSALGKVYGDVTSAFVAAHAARTPTLFMAQTLYPDDPSLVEDARTKALYPAWEYARLKARLEQLRHQDRAPLLANLAAQVAEIKRTIEAGGVIVTGTDSPIDFNGISLHMNLRAMVRYGLTPHQALVTATRASGEYLGQDIGQVRPGYLADLSIVDGDPLQHIEDAARVHGVVRNGQWLPLADIVGPFATQTSTVAALPGKRRFACESVDEAHYWWHHPDWLAQARNTCCDGPCSAGIRV